MLRLSPAPFFLVAPVADSHSVRPQLCFVTPTALLLATYRSATRFRAMGLSKRLSPAPTQLADWLADRLTD